MESAGIDVHVVRDPVGTVLRSIGRCSRLGHGRLLALVQVTDPFCLGPVHAAGRQFTKQFSLGLSFLDACFHVLQYLDIGHRTLRDGRHGAEDERGDQKHPFDQFHI